jgi:hypothetical protein
MRPSGMISKRYPRCITQFMLKRDLVEADYHLNGVGRALSHVRIAAQQLRNTNGREMADYHAYAGVSAARTAIDSMASWLNLWSGAHRRASGAVDLNNERFRKDVDPRLPKAMIPRIDELNRIGVDQIDQHRQRAQHREGLAVVRYEPGGWYLAPEGIQHPRAHDVPLPELLDGWADGIEKAVCEMLTGARPEQHSAPT